MAKSQNNLPGFIKKIDSVLINKIKTHHKGVKVENALVPYLHNILEYIQNMTG